MSKRCAETAAYIEDVSLELAAMARKIGMPMTAYLLEMAAADASSYELSVTTNGQAKRTEAKTSAKMDASPAH